MKKSEIKKLTFKEWFHKNKPEGMSDTVYMKELSVKIEVSRETLRAFIGGMKPSYKTAKALESLTGISAIDLIEGRA